MNWFQFLLLYQFGISSVKNENPDVQQLPPKIIQRHGYPSETHTIATADGYLLNFHRIPYGKSSKSTEPGPAIFLMHGFVGSSGDYIIGGPSHGLGFILADEGYDVWMGNSRGNRYSKAHTTLSPESQEYWEFTYDEIVFYDLPAATDYIIKTTKQPKIAYAGFSLGTTLFFALMSARPEYNAKFNAMIALAPVAYMKHMTTPARIIEPLFYYPEFTKALPRKGEYMSHNELFEQLAKFFCADSINKLAICENLLSILVGYDQKQIDNDKLLEVLTHSPAGTSRLTMIHLGQQVGSGRFCRFNHGEMTNKIKYNSSLPPSYNLEDTKVAVALVYSDNDYFVAPQDFKQLTDRLPNIIESYQINYEGFSHIDFLYAKDAPTLVYKQVIRILAENSPTYNSYEDNDSNEK